MSPTPPAALPTTRCPIRGVGGNPLRTTPHPRKRGFSAESNAPAAGREPPPPPHCKPAFDGAASPSAACPRPARSAAPEPGDLPIGGVRGKRWASWGRASYRTRRKTVAAHAPHTSRAGAQDSFSVPIARRPVRPPCPAERPPARSPRRSPATAAHGRRTAPAARRNGSICTSLTRRAHGPRDRSHTSPVACCIAETLSPALNGSPGAARPSRAPLR